MSHGVRWEETGVEEREGWREGGIIMAGGCQGEREKQREGKKEESEDRERERSPAHSGKTIQLVNEGTHSADREVKREREELPSSGIT